MVTRRRRRERGQALVEFALVAPIFFLILFGIIQLGLILGAQNSLTGAVRETARYAAPYRVVSSSDAASTCATAITTLRNSLAANPLTGDIASRESLRVAYTWRQDPTNLWYVTVAVKVDYKYPLYVPLISNVLDGIDGTTDQSLRITAQEEMRVENDPLAASDSAPPCTYP